MGRPTAEGTVTVGTVNITERDGKFRLRWVDGPKRRERTADTMADAQTMALDIAVELRSPQTARVDGSATALVAAAVDPADHPSWGDGHIETLEGDVRNHIIPAFKNLSCSEVTPRVCADLLNSMADEEYSAHTVDRVRKALKQVVEYGVLHGVWDAGRHPMVGVKMPVSLKSVDLDEIPPEEIPTDDQVAAFIDAMHRGPCGARNGLIVTLAAMAGCRYSEIIALRKSDFDVEKRTFKVTRQVVRRRGKPWRFGAPKSKAGKRTIAIDRTIADEVRAYLDGFDGDAQIFFTKHASPVAPSNWAQAVKRARKVSGYPDSMATHTLRHYCATRWLRVGVPVADVARMLGHANPATTMKLYVSGDADTITRALELL